MTQENLRKPTAWRRTLGALLLVLAPVTAAAVPSGVAHAGDPPYGYDYDARVSFECDRNGPYVSVLIDNDGDWDAEFEVTLLDAWSIEVDSEFGTAVEFFGQRLFSGEIEPGGSYTVEVSYVMGDGPFEVESGTFNCDQLEVDCSNPRDLEVLVTFPEEPELESLDVGITSWYFTAYLLENRNDDDEEAVDDETGGPGDTVVLDAPREGVYYVRIVRDNDVQVITTYRVVVECGQPYIPRPTVPVPPADFYIFNLPTVPTTKAPAPVPVPKTGSDSTSLLIVAPLLILLGGGLILVRRRLVDA